MESPLHQFEIKQFFQLPVAGFDLAFTNAALFKLLAVLLAFSLMYVATSRRALVPGRWQSLAEMVYEMIHKMVHDMIGPEGMRYFPFVFSLFIFILFGNLLGMMPFGFTFTSHIVVTMVLALMVFAAVLIIGFARHGLHFFHLFLPSGVPGWLAPLIIMIELISFLARPLTLALRLFGNMLAGHMVLKIFAGFSVMMGALGFIPLVMNLAVVGLEFFVACLQAYIFTILTCLYLKDAVHLH